MSSSVTIRREIIDAIQGKFPGANGRDDMRWPLEPSDEAKETKTQGRRDGRKGLFDDLSEDEEDSDSNGNAVLREYWQFISRKHQNETFIQTGHGCSEVDVLPENWMVITVALTEDESSLLISRQRPHHAPIVFSVPLKGRREEENEETFTFDDAISEFEDIMRSSQERTHQASNIKSDDKEAKATWWAQRQELDGRLKALLENIEFCWLGAFKV